MNDFGSKCKILGDLWFEYQDDEVFQEFLNANAAGFSLAYSISTGLCTATTKGTKCVDNLWMVFLDQMLVDPKAIYEDLEDVLDSVGSGE